METKPYSLQAPEEIAKEYGGNKQRIAQAIQSGLVDPTAGVLAGMFIDRMRGAQMEEQGAQQSVAQDVMTPGMTPGMAPPMPQSAPQMGGAMPAPAPAQPPMPQGAPQMGGGLEALPVPDDMFSGPGMAGGGLVAFADGGDINFEDLPRYNPQSSSMFPSTPLSGTVGGMVDYLGSLGGGEQRVDPVTGEPVTLGEFLRLQEQRRVTEAREQSPIPVDSGVVRGTVTEPTTTPAPTTSDMPSDDAIADLPPVMVEAELPPEEMPPTTPPAPTSAPASTAESDESALDRYAKMLMGSMQDREATREDARNMAMLQAGLGIMGGESPYALQNIARGALPATQQYQQQMQQAREEERATIGALADLELKARELGLTEKRYNDLARIAEMQIAASGVKGDTSKLRGDIVKLAVQLMKSKEANMEPISLAEAMDEATRALLGGSQTRATDTPTIDFNQLAQ